MQRVVVLGPGAAGKSSLARRLGKAADIPVIDLDQHFWKAGLVPTPLEEWAAVQQELVKQPKWILDGDLGPYDDLTVRLSAADTVIVLDVSRWRCVWRALRRSRERPDSGAGFGHGDANAGHCSSPPSQSVHPTQTCTSSEDQGNSGSSSP